MLGPPFAARTSRHRAGPNGSPGGEATGGSQRGVLVCTVTSAMGDCRLGQGASLLFKTGTSACANMTGGCCIISEEWDFFSLRSSVAVEHQDVADAESVPSRYMFSSKDFGASVGDLCYRADSGGGEALHSLGSNLSGGLGQPLKQFFASVNLLGTRTCTSGKIWRLSWSFPGPLSGVPFRP